MSQMRALFERYGQTVPKSPASSTLLLCRDIAAWCKDEKAAITFVRALPRD
jgi:hypothetical protein